MCTMCIVHIVPFIQDLLVSLSVRITLVGQRFRFGAPRDMVTEGGRHSFCLNIYKLDTGYTPRVRKDDPSGTVFKTSDSLTNKFPSLLIVIKKTSCQSCFGSGSLPYRDPCTTEMFGLVRRVPEYLLGNSPTHCSTEL